jgi:hypothetical protein
MKLRDCGRIADGTVGQIKAEALSPLWISDYWDGPLSGAVQLDGQLCWYVLAEEEQEPYAEGWYRRYWLLELSPAQQDEERRWHDLFRQHVGTHWDHPCGHEAGRGLPVENHRLFYEPYSTRTPLDVDDNEVLGWFQF